MAQNDARNTELPVSGGTVVASGQRDADGETASTGHHEDPITLNEAHGDINVAETISKTKNVYNYQRVINKTQNSVTFNAAQINLPSKLSVRAGTALRKRQPRTEKKKAEAKKMPMVDRPLWAKYWKSLLLVLIAIVSAVLLGLGLLLAHTYMKDDTKKTPHLPTANTPTNAEDYVREAPGRRVSKNQSKKKAADKPGTPETFALHEACRKGRLENVIDLLHSGVDINRKNPSGDTALYLACASGHVGIVKQLLRQGAAVNVSNGQGRTPLHAASANGHTEVVELLCEYDACVNVIDFHGKRPLDEAIAGRHTDIVKILTDRDADVNPESSPVGFASRGKKPNIPKLPEIELPLMSAVTWDYEEIAELLLEKGARINTPDSKNWTELHMAAYKGNLGMVKLLFENGADIHAVTELGATPLCVASQEGHKDVVTFLLQHGADVSHVQKDNATAVMLAAQAGHDQVVRILLQYQNTSAAAGEGMTNGQLTEALYLALQEGHSRTVDILTSNFVIDGPLASKLLLFASARGKVQVVKHLLTLGMDTEVNINGVTPLMLAAAEGHRDVVDLLLSHGADLNPSVNSGGLSPIIAAILHGHDSVVDVILKRSSKENINKGYQESQFTLLEYAMWLGDLKIFNTLLKHGADPTLSRMRSRQPVYPFPVLCSAVSNGSTPFVRALLNHGANPNVKCFKGITPLSFAVCEGKVEITSLLLDWKADTDLDIWDNFTFPVMNFAAFMGKADIVELLIKRNFDLESVAEVCKGIPVTPLGTAAWDGHANVVRVLLEHGANIDTTAGAANPLFVAADFGHTEVVKMLLQYNANTEVHEKGTGGTPLFVASQNGHADIVKLLLDRGANKNAKLKMFKTVSSVHEHQVNRLNKGDISEQSTLKDVKYVYDEVKDVKFADYELFMHSTALYHAALLNRTEVVALLVQHGADLEMTYRYLGHSLTPLYIACMYGFKQIVQILVQGGANVHFRAVDGNTPLHVAGMMRHTDIMNILIKHGANKSARNDEGKTPKELAESSDPEIEFYRKYIKDAVARNVVRKDDHRKKSKLQQQP